MVMQTKSTKRAQAHDEMLKVALSRLGVREAMEVYSGWLEKDQGLNSYRSATQKPMKMITTNSSSICEPEV